MSMFATSLEEHLLPDNKTMEEVFNSDDKEEILARMNICTITGLVEF